MKLALLQKLGNVAEQVNLSAKRQDQTTAVSLSEVLEIGVNNYLQEKPKASSLMNTE